MGLVLAAIVALLAGCGGTGEGRPASAYVREVNAVASSLDSVTNDLYTPSDPSSAAQELRTVQTALEQAQRQLAAIEPPAAIRADHEQLVRAIGELANGVGPLIARLQAGNDPGAGLASSLRGAADARRAIAAIRAAGYEIEIPLLG